MAINRYMCMDMDMHVHDIFFCPPMVYLWKSGASVWIPIQTSMGSALSEAYVGRRKPLSRHSIAANLIHGRWTQARFGGTTLGRRKGPGERNAVPPHLARVPITNMVPAPSGGHSHGYTWRHRSSQGNPELFCVIMHASE